MKKLVLAALVGVAFTGCVQNEEFAPKPQKEISFEVANKVHSTRVGAFDTDETFGAYVWHNDGATLTDLSASDITVGYVPGPPKKWAPTPTLYWPLTGSVDCLAFYPADVKPVVDPANPQNNVITYTYKVKNAAENNVDPTCDVMYANRAYRYTANASNPFGDGFDGIPTLFNHALAKLNFKVALDEVSSTGIVWTAKVRRITVDGVFDNGKLVLTSTDPGTDPAQGTWTLPTPAIWTKVDASTATARNWVDDVDLTDGAPAVEFDETEVYYVLPQALEAGKQKFTIVYDLTQSVDGVTTTKEETKTCDFYVPTAPLKNWEMNKNITYTLTIQPQANVILFAPAVENWVDEPLGTVTIQ